MAIRALIFDVFGTLVDWRTSIAAQAQSSLEPLGYSTDWLAFADAWRNEYQPAMEKVRSGQRGFCKLDVQLATGVPLVSGSLFFTLIELPVLMVRSP